MINRNNMISVLRVVSMLAIVLLHVFSYFGIYEYGILNIFIYVFFLISGFLFSQRDINDKKEFIISRIKKILVPFWIWSLFLSITVAIIKKEYKLGISSFVISLLNMYGLDHFFFGRSILNNYQIEGLMHCWFITCIFICYVLLALLKNTRIESYIKNNLLKCFIVLLLFQSFFALFLKIQIIGIFVFFIGYFLNDDVITIKKCFFVTICSLLFGFIRICLHNYIDGTVLYDAIIQPYFNTLAGLSILIICLYAYRSNSHVIKLINKISRLKICKWLEINSYYIYIVHYAFLKSPFNVSIFIESPIIQLILFFMLMYISTCILNRIHNLIVCKSKIKKILR